MGPSPGNGLAADRADLTLGKTATCIFVAKFYGRMPFLSPIQTFRSPRPPPVPYSLGLCAVPLAPGRSSALPLDHCHSTGKSGLLTPAVKLLSPKL